LKNYKVEESPLDPGEASGSIPVIPVQPPSGSILSKIKHVFKGGNFDFSKDVAKLVTGNVLVQIISLGLSPLMTRLYLPEYFGIAAVFSSLYTFFANFTCLRYDVTVALTKTKEEAADMLTISVLFAFLTTIILLPIVWLMRNWLATILQTPILANFVWLAPLVSFAIGVFNALNYWNIRQRKFTRLSFALVLQEFVMDTIRLGAGFLGYTSGATLIFSNAAGAFSSFGELLRRLIKEDRDSFKTIRWENLKKNIVRYRKFPLFNIWAGLISNFSQQLPTLMLAAFFSTTVTGYYSLGYRMTRLPVIILSGAIAQVFLQRASKARHEGGIDILVKSTYKQLLKLGIFPLLLITLVGNYLFTVILGPKWTDAGVYAQILSLWIFSMFISTPLFNLANVYERQEINLIINSIGFVTRAVSLLIGGIYHNVILGLALFAITGVLVEVGYMQWAFRLTGVSIPWCISELIKSFLFSLPFLLLVGVGDWVFHLKPLFMVGLSLLAAILYYGAIVIRDPEIGKFLKGLQKGPPAPLD
jgi:lipopolysaccharide exporter